MPASDDAIVQRVCAGDTEAFGHLVVGHRKSVYSIAAATTGDADEAEDIVQSAFVEAFRRIGELRDGHRFGSWLHAITRNMCSDWLRRHSRAAALFGDPSKLQSVAPAELPDPPHNPSTSPQHQRT